MTSYSLSCKERESENNQSIFIVPKPLKSMSELKGDEVYIRGGQLFNSPPPNILDLKILKLYNLKGFEAIYYHSQECMDNGTAIGNKAEMDRLRSQHPECLEDEFSTESRSNTSVKLSGGLVVKPGIGAYGFSLGRTGGVQFTFPYFKEQPEVTIHSDKEYIQICILEKLPNQRAKGKCKDGRFSSKYGSNVNFHSNVVSQVEDVLVDYIEKRMDFEVARSMLKRMPFPPGIAILESLKERGRVCDGRIWDKFFVEVEFKTSPPRSFKLMGSVSSCPKDEEESKQL